MASASDTNLGRMHSDKTVNGDLIEKKDDEAKKFQLSSDNSDQRSKTNEDDDNLNAIKQKDSLSLAKSSNDDKMSYKMTSASNESSDTDTEKKSEEQKLQTATITKQEAKSDPMLASSISTPDEVAKNETSSANSVASSLNEGEDNEKHESETSPKSISSELKIEKKSKKVDSTPQFAASDPNKDEKKNDNNGFSIEKGDAQYLTDFQRQKAKYFFNVNLDIENKEYVTWEDVEFYLLFHLTAAGKEGLDSEDLQGRLSRATRVFWEHVHDQVPLPYGSRDKLTLDQFLDTWASLVDYVVRTNRLPPIIQDLVKLGFELYSTDNNDGKSETIQPIAFDQLFQKMYLGRPYAIMAYKFLTENGTKPLDADRIESIVKAVITSSDDEHDSHFLLPGFFKTINNNKNKEEEKDSKPEIAPGKAPSEVSDSSSSRSTPTQIPKPTLQSQPPNGSSVELKQSYEPSSPSMQKQNLRSPLSSQKQSTTSKTRLLRPSTNHQPNVQSLQAASEKAPIQEEDESVRRLLRFYHIDDGDIVEVTEGSVHRTVLVHPERPLPAYIRQNKELLKRLHPDSGYSSSPQQSGLSDQPNMTTETRPQVTLQEHSLHSRAQQGPTVPLRQEQQQRGLSSTNVRQIYPQLNKAQQEEQQRQAKLQATQPVKDERKTTPKATSTANDLSSPKEDDKRKKDLTHEQEKLVAAILKRLTPIVERQVAVELQHLQSGETDRDKDDGFMPFPFVLAAGGEGPFFSPPRGAPPPQIFPQRQQRPSSQRNTPNQNQQQQPPPPSNKPSENDFDELSAGATFVPPQLLMAMISDLTRGAMGGEIPNFSPDMSSSPRGPAGAPVNVEGLIMFVDDNPMMGGPPRHPPHPEPRF